jgi:hypothetical protein
MGRILSKEGQRQRDQFNKLYDGGNCTCHIQRSAPCGSCMHPGNPANQEENDEAWERVDVNIWPHEEGGFEVMVQTETAVSYRTVPDYSEIGDSIMVLLAEIHLNGFEVGV